MAFEIQKLCLNTCKKSKREIWKTIKIIDTRRKAKNFLRNHRYEYEGLRIKENLY